VPPRPTRERLAYLSQLEHAALHDGTLGRISAKQTQAYAAAIDEAVREDAEAFAAIKASRESGNPGVPRCSTGSVWNSASNGHSFYRNEHD
jgi:hypothetical protein